MMTSETPRQLLEAYNYHALLDIARFNRIPMENKSGKRLYKRELVRELEKRLFTKKHVREALEQLSPVERKVLDVLLLRGGRANTTAFQRLLVGHGIVSPTRGKMDPWNPSATDFDSVVARLTLHGLVFSAEGPISDLGYTRTVLKRSLKPGPSLYIPPTIRKHLPSPDPELLQRPARVSRIQSASARTLQRDLYLYWSYVRDHRVQVTLKGEVYKRALRELANSLLTPIKLEKKQGERDVPYLLFLRRLLMSLNLLTLRGRKDLIANDASHFLAADPAQRVRRSFEAWLDGDFWNELYDQPLPHVSITTGGGALPYPTPKPIVEARRQVVRFLQKLSKPSAQDWVALSNLIEAIRVEAYEFLLPRNYRARSSSYYYSYYYYGPLYKTPYAAHRNPLGWTFQGVTSEEEGWDLVEAPFIANVITGPLHWLGLVDLGYGDAGQDPVAYRLTPLGAWLLGLGPPVEIPTEKQGRIIVQPNFQILAMDPVSDQTLATLDIFADRISAERAIEYRMSRESVYRGQQQGWSAQRIIAYLEEVSGGKLPQNVVVSLQEWQALHERITLYRRVVLVHAQDPEVLDRLSRHPNLTKLLHHRPAPTAALVHPRQVDALIKALGTAGVLPVVTRQAGKEENCLVADEEGNLRLVHRTPSIYLARRLDRFAERVDDHHYRITPDSVQKALEQGLDAPAILQELSVLHQGPLPFRLTVRVKAWAHHYGDAALQSLTLLQLRDQAALQELLQDPEVGPFLRRFNPPPERALALVTQDDLETLRRLLTERGMALSDTLLS
ncbi:MAG: hypothetical protein D6759_06675 [Chloroflexi bacterium]|nr:MAG: hypothetical protein D6759_06675 [Chloroflexota bacterium]